MNHEPLTIEKDTKLSGTYEFDCPNAFVFAKPGLKVYGNAVIKGAGFDVRERCSISGLTFQDAPDSVLAGGSRALQTGGGSVLENVTMERCGRLWLSGMSHRLRNLTVIDSPGAVLWVGLPGLPIDKPDECGVNKAVIDGLRLVRCGATYKSNADWGLVGGGRDFSSDLIIRNLSAFECHGKVGYFDDGFSNVTCEDWSLYRTKGRALHHGGGKRNRFVRILDVDSELPSIFDDRLNPYAPMGKWGHGLICQQEPVWKHGDVEGKAAAWAARQRVKNCTAYFRDKPAFLARMKHFLSDLENEATWRSSFELDYRPHGTTPNWTVT